MCWISKTPLNVFYTIPKIGNNCECPFIESIPTILQVCGGFGIVLFSTVYVAAKYFTKRECCGMVFLTILAFDILGYTGCLIAGTLMY